MAVRDLLHQLRLAFVSFFGGVEIIDPVRKWVFKPPHTDLMACKKIYESFDAD